MKGGSRCRSGGGGAAQMEDEQVRLVQMMALLQLLVVEQLGLVDLSLSFPSSPFFQTKQIDKELLISFPSL